MLPASTTGRSGASLPDAHERGIRRWHNCVTRSARSTSLPSGRIAAVTAVSASLPTLNIAKTMIRPAEATTKYASNQNIEPTLRWTHSDRPALLCEVKPLYGMILLPNLHRQGLILHYPCTRLRLTGTATMRLLRPIEPSEQISNLSATGRFPDAEQQRPRAAGMELGGSGPPKPPTAASLFSPVGVDRGYRFMTSQSAGSHTRRAPRLKRLAGAQDGRRDRITRRHKGAPASSRTAPHPEGAIRAPQGPGRKSKP